MIIIGILITAAIGAIVSGWISDRIGFKKSLMLILGSWVIILPLMGITSNFTIFIILSILMGFFYGATWSVSRATMTILCPQEKLNFGFSFYTIAERFSTLIGPLVWGLMTFIFINSGPIRYRIAVSTMAIFVIIGIFILKKVNIDNKQKTTV
jgi:UMF1 family MFS transporter